MSQARIDRQAEKVARLSRELRFELLLLGRMRARAAGHAAAAAGETVFGSMAEVYAAALTRRAGSGAG